MTEILLKGVIAIIKKSIYPFIFAVYPVVFLYSYNVQELMLKQLFMPFVIALFSSVILFLLFNYLIKDKHKSALIVFIVVLFFFNYGYIYIIFDKISFLDLKHRHVLPITLFVASYISYFIYTMRNSNVIEKISMVLNVVALTLIIMNIFRILPYEIKKYNIAVKNRNIKNDEMVSNININHPDIYYIILDEYASLSTIKSIWNYDNSEFVEYLKNKEFYITENSKTRHIDTLYSIASSLNMEYVSIEENKLSIYEKINNNKVMDYLKNKGYKTIVFDNLYNISYPAKGEIKADFNLKYISNDINNGVDQYSLLLIDHSILKPFKFVFDVYNINNQYVNRNPAYASYRNSTLFTFDKLKRLDYIESPKFIYAHILCPHTPFLFDSKGNGVEIVNGHNWRNKSYYLEQYIYVSKQTQALVDSIIKSSTNQPIIIIQSDHGPRPNSSPKANENLDMPKEEMYKIFNSYYLPGFDMKNLYNNISPVNTFRLIFNHYFNDNFVLQED